MALAVLYYSPLTLLYWYGQPKEYANLPERKFFRAIPTVWDETRWLGGEIGEWAMVARRSGKEWFIGAITNETARTVTTALDFLRAENFAPWIVRIYSDKLSTEGKPDPQIVRGVSRIEVTNTVLGVDRETSLVIPLAATGGVALWLTPK
jgi:alpha-glucosidase